MPGKCTSTFQTHQGDIWYMVQRDFVVFLACQESWFRPYGEEMGRSQLGQLNSQHRLLTTPCSQKSTQSCQYSPPESTEPQLRVRKAPLMVKYISQALGWVLQVRQVRQPSPWEWAMGTERGKQKASEESFPGEGTARPQPERPAGG